MATAFITSQEENLKSRGVLPVNKKGHLPGFLHENDLMGGPLKNAQFWSSSRKAKISTAGIHSVF